MLIRLDPSEVIYPREDMKVSDLLAMVKSALGKTETGKL